MDAEYLRKGIVGLSRVLDCPGEEGKSDRGWFAGHWPCAVIAAYYFCRDNPIEPGVDELVTREVDRMIDCHNNLFSTYDIDRDEETPIRETRQINDIIGALESSITRYVSSGHNVIYAAHALQVLSERPDLATDNILSGIYTLVEYFSGKQGIIPLEYFADEKSLTAKYGNEDDMIQNVFATLQYASRLVDRGRLLFDGHTITHAHALVTLSKLGHMSIAQSGYDSHRVHMEKNRDFQSQHIMERWKEKITVEDHPFTMAYWDRDFNKIDRQWEVGHVFKYLHSFYALVNSMHDPLKKRCYELQLAYLI